MIALVLAATALTTGSWYFESTGWERGKEQWAGTGNIVADAANWRKDWSGYDRLSIDMVNEGGGGDFLFCSILSPETKKENSARYMTATPDYRFKRWIVPLKEFKGRVSITNVTSVRFSTRWGRRQKLHLSNLRLLKKGEPSGGGTFSEAPPDRQDLRELVARAVAAGDVERAKRHAESLERFSADCAAAGTSSAGVLFGSASPMTRVMPRDAFNAEPATNLFVRLARNETEALQFLVAPVGEDLKDVRISVSELVREVLRPDGGKSAAAFDATNIAAKVVGYCDMKVAPDYSYFYTDVSNGLRRTRGLTTFGWHPNPILDFLDGIDIRKGDVQGFWIDVRCPATQPAGVYRGRLRVSWKKGDGDDGVRFFPFAVRVNDFALPLTPPVPMNIGFYPRTRGMSWRADNLPGDYYADEQAIESDKKNPARMARRRIWEWTDFLADRYITVDFLYPAVAPRWNELVRLKEQGRLGHFNLKYWTDRYNNDRWFADARMRYEKAKKLGLLEHAVFYGMDELRPHRFPAGSNMIARLKREFPEAVLNTTCKDISYGCNSPLGGMDVFIPYTPKYNEESARKARSSGRKVGWYVAGGGDEKVPNFFFARQPLESRLVMGAMAVKYRPEWFLYYQIAIWDSNRPITKGPFTDWGLESWMNFSGDGSLVACGPGGKPLSTIRLENFRDGLDDCHYAKILEARGGKAEVPQSLVVSLTAFSDDVKAYQRWRDAMADAIERLPAVDSEGSGL